KAGGVIAPCWALPVPGRTTAGIELDVEIGFGTAATDVPDVLRHAVRTLVAHWYENRGLIAIGQTVAIMPASVSAMIASYRVRGL
ncbi:MAG: head-tail connector protein, partial [Nitrobacter sp.]